MSNVLTTDKLFTLYRIALPHSNTREWRIATGATVKPVAQRLTNTFEVSQSVTTIRPWVVQEGHAHRVSDTEVFVQFTEGVEEASQTIVGFLINGDDLVVSDDQGTPIQVNLVTTHPEPLDPRSELDTAGVLAEVRVRSKLDAVTFFNVRVHIDFTASCTCKAFVLKRSCSHLGAKEVFDKLREDF